MNDEHAVPNTGDPFYLRAVGCCKFEVIYPTGQKRIVELLTGDVMKFGSCAVLTEAASVRMLQDQLESLRESLTSQNDRMEEMERDLEAYHRLYGPRT